MQVASCEPGKVLGRDAAERRRLYAHWNRAVERTYGWVDD